MDPQGRAPLADAEFDDPLGWCGPVAAAALFFVLPSGEGGDLRVDALQPHGVPDPQSVQAVEVGRQVTEHIFDSMPMIRRRALACAGTRITAFSGMPAHHLDALADPGGRLPGSRVSRSVPA
ncbi:hypothetical protein AB0K81_17900 [Streptomyces werraensis]|uniref:Uncharacterized protein n=1 Tax=Streptomyces werraensis TaxID=68284 RepID=A0ABV3JEG7_9ACTN